MSEGEVRHLSNEAGHQLEAQLHPGAPVLKVFDSVTDLSDLQLVLHFSEV